MKIEIESKSEHHYVKTYSFNRGNKTYIGIFEHDVLKGLIETHDDGTAKNKSLKSAVAKDFINQLKGAK